jgi:hypothetical protein
MAIPADPPAVSASILPSGRGFPTASMDPESLALLAYARLLLAPSSPIAAAADHPLPAWFATEPAQLNAAASLVWTPDEAKLPALRCACGARKAGALSAIGHLEACDRLGQKAGLDAWLDEAQRADCYAYVPPSILEHVKGTRLTRLTDGRRTPRPRSPPSSTSTSTSRRRTTTPPHVPPTPPSSPGTQITSSRPRTAPPRSNVPRISACTRLLEPLLTMMSRTQGRSRSAAATRPRARRPGLRRGLLGSRGCRGRGGFGRRCGT